MPKAYPKLWKRLWKAGRGMADGRQGSPKRRKMAHVSLKRSAAGTDGRGGARRPTDGAEVEPRAEPGGKLVHFDDHPAFTAEDLMAASRVVLGKGTYGTVFRATLGDGNQVAVRRVKRADLTVGKFEVRLDMLGKVRHPNLLPFRAYFLSHRRRSNLLTFDYMPKGSLSAFLHGRLRFILRDFLWPGWLTFPYTALDPYNGMDWWLTPHSSLGPCNCIDWPTRKNIAIGIARGLNYLYTEKNMVHGNLTSGNVLLDEHAHPKIADYGLYGLVIPAAYRNVIVNTGALGYHAPELSELKEPNHKTDVYSLGVIMLELLTGKSPGNAIENLHLLEWVAWIVKEQRTDEVFDPDLMMDIVGATRNELFDTLMLALRCVDPSSDTRPDTWEVLQQLEGIKPKFARASDAATTRGGNEPTDGCAHIAVPTTGERIAQPPKVPQLGTCEASNVLGNDGTLQAQLPPPVDSSCYKVEEHAMLASKDDPEDGDHIPLDPPSTPLGEINQALSGYENSTIVWSPALTEGNAEMSIPITNMEEKAMVEDKAGENMSTEETDVVTGVIVDSQVPSIDWADMPLEAHLQVPTLPSLISSDPDLGYQRYFQTLYDLAYRSPPLPSNLLERQLNWMVMGLHSLGYPLDTWLKAASFVLILAKKREYFEHHMDEYFKVPLETQLAELASSIAPIEAKVSKSRSDQTVLEQKWKELDEAIAKLEDQLLVFKTQHQEVMDSLTASRDQLASAEAKMLFLLADMDQVKQQYSAVLEVQRELLQELPSIDEAFDSSFREILTKKF